MQSASFVPSPPTHAGTGFASASQAPRAGLGGHGVAVLPMVTAFFSSLSPGYQPTDSDPVVSFSSGRAQQQNWSEATAGVVQQLKLASNIASSWLPQFRVVSEAVTAVCSSFSLAHDLGRVLDKKDEQKSSADCQSTNRAAKAAALTLVALDTIGCATAADAEPGSAQNPIIVHDSKTLDQIGQPGYPTDAYYLQNQSFSHNSTEPVAAFHGHYDGGCHTITDLHTCLFSHLGPYAEIRNLRLADSTINGSGQYLAVLACEMAPYAKSSNIRVEHSHVSNRRAGRSGEPTATGIITGYQHRAAHILGSELHNCSVISSADHALVGALGGQIDGLVKNAVIAHTHVKTTGIDAPAGVGAGKLTGHMAGMIVFDSQADTTGNDAVAGIGAGLVHGTVEGLTVAKCRVYTRGKQSHAAVGAGQAGDRDSLAYGFVDGLVSVDNQVDTAGQEAATGIAVGQLHGENNKVTSVRCSARATGRHANTGIGHGSDQYNTGESRNLVMVNSTVDSKYGIASLDRGTVRGITSLNNRIRGRLQHSSDMVDLTNLCSRADPRLISANCAVVPALQYHNCTSPPPNASSWLAIEINDTDSLNRIGQHADYPAYAHYLQTNNLNGSQLNHDSARIFSGHYDGQNHVIEELSACLFKHLQGTVRNLHLTRARITADGQSTGVVACQMSDASTIDNITVSHSRVFTRGPALAGIISGERQGLANQITRVEVTNSSVHSQGEEAHAGVIAGQCHGQTHQAEIHNSQASTEGYGACAGVGGGTVKGRLAEATFTCSRAETRGTRARAGIGAGVVRYGRVGPMTVTDGEVHTRSRRAHAGIGAGDIDLFGAVGDIDVLNSQVLTRDRDADAGIGAGSLDAARFGRAYGIRSIGCRARAAGDQSQAGMGVGGIDITEMGDARQIHRIANFTSVNGTVEAPGRQSHASVNGVFRDWGSTGQRADPAGSVTINTRISDRLHDSRNINQGTLEPQRLSTLCASADPRYVQPDCQTNPNALAQNCPVPPPLLVTTPAAPPALTNTGFIAAVLGGLVAGGLVLVGCTALGVYCYNRHHQTPPPESDQPLTELDSGTREPIRE